jgi:hypothetical protein
LYLFYQLLFLLQGKFDVELNDLLVASLHHSSICELFSRITVICRSFSAEKMDLSVLKGPAEVLASRVKAFKNCLELATECLTNKDYVNAEMIYGGLLADLHKNCVVEVLNLNDLELFSLHSCFAYSSIGSDFKSEQALVILNSIHKPIKLPLVPYLKAFVHISNDR